MPRYEDENMGYSGNNMRQKDIVLSTNEYMFIQSKTDGQIKTYTGPLMVTISTQESMVVFNQRKKTFEETNDLKVAKQLFTSAPEGWYVVLKNPAKDSAHPEAAKPCIAPRLEIGKKVNISGPCSFSLYPGQMTKVIKGHRLRSNQYLLARVYDADAASKSVATMVDVTGNEIEAQNTYFVGQLLVIKGTEVSFYMPPTGIEVIADENDSYVRDAVTLERLEYVILKDESGEKRYVPGPAVVFPEPTETFVKTPAGSVIFRALELSPISGIYVKVIADYTEEDGTERKTGDELFITGNDQMIYYPRPEHAMIQYDGKYMHHAIAIPEGEGRYILNRLTGEIKTVVGPAMYLPDPRTEVVVKRKLSEKECDLYYPGNKAVRDYNAGLTEKAMERRANKGLVGSSLDCVLNSVYSTSNQEDTLAIFEATSNISRGVSYTKPRTITLDTKFDGVVSIDVWNGYAISVVSKSGKREVVVGPQTRLLDYDETLETIVTPEGTTAFLKLNNNKISDIINVVTKDYVQGVIKLNYTVDFDGESKDWFSIYDYPAFVLDTMRNLIKKKVKTLGVEEFYENAIKIVNEAVAAAAKFSNGATVTDVEINKVTIDKEIEEVIFSHKAEMIKRNLELSEAEKKMEVIKALAENNRKELELKNETDLYKLELDQKVKTEKFNMEEARKEQERIAITAATVAKADLQPVLDEINKAEIARKKDLVEAEVEKETKLAEIEKAKQDAYAATVVSIMRSIQPGLIEAMNAGTQAELINGIGKAISPYTLAGNESAADVVAKLTKGTSIEDLVKQFKA